MSAQNRFTDEFTKDAVSQVVDRGYPVTEVAERLGRDQVDLHVKGAVLKAWQGA